MASVSNVARSATLQQDSADSSASNVLLAAHKDDRGNYVYSHGTWWWSWWWWSVKDEAERLYKDFVAFDDDIVLCSSPKTGTTWLKTILLCIKHHGTESSDIVEHVEAHGAAPCIETKLEGTGLISEDEIKRLARPRFYQTHMPLRNVPQSIRQQRCKLIYITRNPKDMLVSAYKFQFPEEEGKRCKTTIDEMVRNFCDGLYMYGPFDTHVKEYWHESQKGKDAQNPVFFLQYEQLLRDPVPLIRQLGEYIGKHLSVTDAESIAQRCSMANIKKLAPNVNESKCFGINNKVFFRKGKIGNWRDELSDEQSGAIDRYVEEKFAGSGLEFTFE